MAAVESVAAKLGIGTAQTLLSWVGKDQVDTGKRPGVTTEMAEELRRLRAENRELKRANEILKTASTFFAAELCAGRVDLRLYRPEQGSFRRRADLSGADRARRQDRAEHLLRRPSPASLRPVGAR